MRPELLAAGLAALPGLFAAAAADLVRRERLQARAGAAPRGSSLASRWARTALRGPAARALGLVAGFGIGGALAGAPGAAAGAVTAAAVPVVKARKAEAQRAQRIEEQLAEAVSGVAAGLRAGLSLVQAIAVAGDELREPLGPALRQLADRVLLGAPFTESLDRWVAEVDRPEARLVAGVLRLHHRTGGDLPAVLDQLGRTLRDRGAAAREVRSLTAQARLSGAILGFLPVGFFLFLSATSRPDMAAAYHSPMGATAIGAGLAMQGVAFLWIRRLLRVDG